MKNVAYRLYNKESDKLIASGSAKECAETLGTTVYTFHNLLSRIKRGENKKYGVERYSNIMGRKYNLWSKEEDEFVKANCDKMTAIEIAKHLGRAPSTVRSNSYILGVNFKAGNYGGHGETLCWDCKNYYKGCSWSRDFKAVDGWTAKKTKAGYLVLKCPKFERG